MYFKCIIIVHIVWLGFSAAFPNLATYGTAIQSSVYSDSKNSYDASRVIDGNTNQLFTARSCCHTAVGQSSAWWRLDLGSPAYIHRVVLYYRKYQNDRLRGYYLYVSDSFSQGTPNYGHLCYHYPLNSELPTSIQNKTCDVIGRYVVFYNERNREDQAFVELCEVEIFGCYVGRYGSQCEFACSDNCNDVTCSIWDGSCTSCKAGFTGDRCDQACEHGRYGPNCNNACTHCQHSECNNSNGRCKHGCSAGWKGQKCEQPCIHGTYGPNCRNVCNTCKFSSCNQVDGNCTNECIAGWEGLKCEKRCNARTYGENCRRQCHCFDGVACDNVNGQCPDGLCDPGWKSNTCSQKCDKGKFGKNCLQTCKNCKFENCDRFNGTCDPLGICKSGWRGQGCNQACDTGSYGINCSKTCRNCINEDCDNFEGICQVVGRCRAGYLGSKCSKACESPFFGDNCQQTCNCVNGTLCNNVDGVCELDSCDRGWMGSSCVQPCAKGQFGYNCLETCIGCLDEDCEPFSGNCTKDGCRNVYTGYRCHLLDNLTLKNDKGQSTQTGGIIGAILAVIAIIVVGILIYRKRAIGHGKPIRSTQFSNDVKEKCNTEYSNETFETPPYAKVENENQMSLHGLDDYREISVETGNSSTTNNVYANGTRRDNIYQNTELKDTANLYSSIEANTEFSEYNIVVDKLPSIAKMKRKNYAFKKEYAMLPKGSNFPHLEGERKENRQKNRFLTTFPYDHSRVKLEMRDNSTDYINANYMKNYNKDKAYIATQGPKKITLSDFWQMIWQENVDTIVMVTKLMEGEKKKCEQYWPESTYKQLVIDEFTLKMLVEKENTVYTYRCIQLLCGNTNRTVHHFHFTKWPDHDVPDKTDLVNFYRKVKSPSTNLSGPMVVHCSAGIGRTGTFLALDALYEHGKATGFVNIMEYTHMMRQDRMNMIQTVEQYATVYDVLVEAFTVPQSAIPRQDFLKMLDSRLIEREYQKLLDLKPVIEAIKFEAGKRKENISKNAVQNILPHDDYRPYLMSYGRSSNDYINAVKIPSFIEGSNIFVTQYPLLNTIGDLWSLVYDNDCRTIVILEEINEDVPVIPSDTDHKISNDNFIISRNSQNVSQQDGVKVSLRHKNKKEERPITVFVYNDWEDTYMIPNSTKTMVDFLEIVSRTTRADHESIVVICRDGCTRSGIFVTLKLVLEKMETDDEVDIFQVSRRIQTRRPQFLSSIEQYEFCYSAVKELLSRESVYANA